MIFIPNISSHKQQIIGYNINVPFEPVCGTRDFSVSRDRGSHHFSPILPYMIPLGKWLKLYRQLSNRSPARCKRSNRTSAENSIFGQYIWGNFDIFVWKYELLKICLTNQVKYDTIIVDCIC